MLSPKVLPTHAASTCHPGALTPVGEVLAVWEDDGGRPAVARDSIAPVPRARSIEPSPP